jgi:hypothetical protein
MDLPSSMEIQIADAKRQTKQDRTGRGHFEVSTLREVVVSKHEEFKCSRNVSPGKGLQPPYQVFKLSMVGRFRLVEFLP